MASLGFSSDSSDSEAEREDVASEAVDSGEPPPVAKRVDVRAFIDDAAEDSDEGGEGMDDDGEEEEDYVKVRVLGLLTRVCFCLLVPRHQARCVVCRSQGRIIKGNRT